LTLTLREIQCVCGARFYVTQYLLDLMRKRDDKVIYCPIGHQLMLSTIPDIKDPLYDAIREIEEKFRQ
jgi:hypothetical protein